MQTQTYTGISGEIVAVEQLDWLEDGTYYDADAEEELTC